MTGGLKELAGKALRSFLIRYTRTPTSGAMLGASCTAVLQSSSATTVAAVGFVNAELMSFQNALGIIFGANLGTTLTGWIVVLLGFKLKLGLMALPLILVGACMKLFFSGKTASVGFALAGFGLIFVGISTLQNGMSDMQTLFNFAQLPGDTLTGRLQLLGLGVLFTIVTQSSSAGIAAALTALFAGIIQWEQAAALIIGMDIGTTVTAAMATIGANINAKRTGYSHVIYNLFTGLMALLLITPFIHFMEFLVPGVTNDNAELMLVAFHSSFNFLGVLLILPFTRSFAAFIDRLVKAPPSSYTSQLDEELLEDPARAMTAIQDAALKEYLSLLKHMQAILNDDREKRVNLLELQKALDETHLFIDQVKPTNSAELSRLKALLELLDHLQRLHERCEEDEDRAITARHSTSVKEIYTLLCNAIPTLQQHIKNNHWHAANLLANQLHVKVEGHTIPYREKLTELIAIGEMDVPEGTDQLESIRWMQRVSLHICRIHSAIEQSITC